MKTILVALMLSLYGTVVAASEMTTVIPWEEPFHPQYFLYNRDLGTIYQMEGGTVTGPTRILPNPGSRNPATMPFIPPSRPRNENYWSSPDMAIDLNQQLDRDLNRMLGLPE